MAQTSGDWGEQGLLGSCLGQVSVSSWLQNPGNENKECFLDVCALSQGLGPLKGNSLIHATSLQSILQDGQH